MSKIELLRSRAEEKQLEELKKERINSLYKDAFLCYENELYKEAGIFFRQILEIDSSQKKARFYLERKIPEQLKNQPAYY
jgi:hypothetical protein